VAAPARVCEGVDPMGRGRAKAKQTKVARDLKYRTYETDFSELQRELHGEPDTGASPAATPADDVDDDEDHFVYDESDPARRV
jgi:Protein of unknown function (DUF3073)